MAPKKEAKVSPGGSLLNRLVKASKSDLAVVMGEQEEYEIKDFINTGNYLFNAIVSGDPLKGYPSGKVITLSGKAASGKTFLALEAIKNAQSMGYTAVLYDTEFASNNKDELKNRGIDVNNLVYVPINTVEELKSSVVNILEEIKDEKVMIVIDSIGNLSTNKELGDALDANDKADTGARAKHMKALFRIMTLKAGIKHVPIISINHVYDMIGSFIPGQTVQASGSGISYMSSIIIEFGKAQEKTGKDITGTIVTAKAVKNRFAKEKSKVKFSIDFSKGLNPYSGLLGFCEEEGLFKKDGMGYNYEGIKYSRQDLSKPAFWDNLLNTTLGDYMRNKFKYQSTTEGLEPRTEDDFVDELEAGAD